MHSGRDGSHREPKDHQRNDSRDFQDAESVRSGHSHVASQPVSFPPHPVPGGMLSLSLRMPSRKNGSPSIWDTHVFSGNVFAKQAASSSAPYLQELNPWSSGRAEPIPHRPQIQYTDKFADDSVAVQRLVSPRTTETKHRIFKLTVNIFNQRIFKLVDLAHEITGVKVVQKKGKQTVSLKLAKKEKKTWHKLLDDDSTKEVVADDTASSNTNFTSRVNQTTLSDFSKNLEEPSHTLNEEEEVDD